MNRCETCKHWQSDPFEMLYIRDADHLSGMRACVLLNDPELPANPTWILSTDRYVGVHVFTPPTFGCTEWAADENVIDVEVTE
jgi:hypothetical protein